MREVYGDTIADTMADPVPPSRFVEVIMSTASSVKTTVAVLPDAAVTTRIIEEGYGPGAWHGADMRAAVADVTAKAAFVRPQPGRHNIAEIALHHAWYVRSAANQLSGTEGSSFVLDGSDWFDLPDAKTLAWPKVTATLEREQDRLATIVGDLGAGRLRSPLPPSEQFDLILGITCHAVYHAGQIQLIKVLASA
jgi:hypothetical protein